jgi:VanZ family protein
LARVIALPGVRAGALVLASAMLFVIFTFAPALGTLTVPPWDKLAHAGYFGGVAALLLVGLGVERGLLALAFTSLAGVADEIHQMSVPGRHADVLDWLTDTAAAAVVIVLVRMIAARRE